MSRPRLRALGQLLRAGNLPTVWSNVLAGGLLGGATAPLAGWLAVLAALSAWYLAGMVLNDLADRDHDRRLRPDRPLVRGALPGWSAWLLMVGLFGAGGGLLALAPAPGAAVLPGAALLALIVLYDLFHKGNPLAPLLMGLCRGLTYPLAALALGGAGTPEVAGLAALQTLYVLLLTVAARSRARSGRPLPVPLLIAGIAGIDGLALALLLHPAWLLPGLAAAGLTLLGQRLAPGDCRLSPGA